MALNAPILQPFSNITPTSFVATWTSVPEATNYVLYVARNLTETETGDGNFIYTLSNYHPGYNGKLISGLRWEVTNLLPSTVYYVRVDSRAGTQTSLPYRPRSIGLPEQPVRKTSRGLRVDFALREYFLKGIGEQAQVLRNLLKGTTLKDGTSSPASDLTATDMYAVASMSAYDPAGFPIDYGFAQKLNNFPKASSFLNKTVLGYIKNFKGKVVGIIENLRSNFKSFNERSSSAIEKATPVFKTPYGMYGPAYAGQFFIKDGIGAEAVPVGSDTGQFGYWELKGYSSLQDPEKVVSPRIPVFTSDPNAPAEEPPNVYVDLLRIGNQFNISVPSSGQGGLKDRPSAVNSDTGAMLIVRSVSEPGRLFFVKTERLN